MKHEFDPFRPREAVAAAIYDALVAEGAKRKARPDLTWIQLELDAVYSVASEQARIRGWKALSRERIQRLEILARGHVDYSAKWARYIARELDESNNEQRSAPRRSPASV